MANRPVEASVALDGSKRIADIIACQINPLPDEPTPVPLSNDAISSTHIPVTIPDELPETETKFESSSLPGTTQHAQITLTEITSQPHESDTLSAPNELKSVKANEFQTSDVIVSGQQFNDLAGANQDIQSPKTTLLDSEKDEKEAIIYENSEVKKTTLSDVDQLFEPNQDVHIPKSTFLDSGDDDDRMIPTIGWGNMVGTTMLSAELANEDDSDEEYDDDTQSQTSSFIQKNPGLKKKKRSPNRDDSDSEDEDGVKIIKNIEEISEEELIDLNFNPFNDHQSISNGFKVGFSEDRNKKYRRSMEDAHTIQYDFGSLAGSGINFLT